ncbi:hypothetical protein ATY79_24085 [Rhizobium sp. R693]|nr:hypothetical protein ATY79_24085 [Rhizobium sp. R693]
MLKTYQVSGCGSAKRRKRQAAGDPLAIKGLLSMTARHKPFEEVWLSCRGAALAVIVSSKECFLAGFGRPRHQPQAGIATGQPWLIDRAIWNAVCERRRGETSEC